MELRCPFCDAETNSNFDDVTDRSADDFDSHYIGITCSECGEYYEISYRPVDILYWDAADEPRTSSTSTRPVDRDTE